MRFAGPRDATGQVKSDLGGRLGAWKAPKTGERGGPCRRGSIAGAIVSIGAQNGKRGPRTVCVKGGTPAGPPHGAGRRGPPRADALSSRSAGALVPQKALGLG